MRVVLVHFRENYTLAPPMGILYIGTVLRNAGYNVQIIDSFPAHYESAIRRITYFQPDLIGISVLTTGYSIASRYTSLLKQQNPNALFCWGGVHASSLPEEVLKEQDIDFVVIGEGEETMLEVCNNLSEGKGLEGIKGIAFKKKGKILNNGSRPFIENLDSLPFADRALLKSPPFSWYLSPPGILRGKFYCGITTMYTSRGCPYQCIFCASKTVHGYRLRRRTVASVIDEMRYLKNNFGVYGIYFIDDTFAIDRKWLEEFCNTFKKNDLKMIWGCQTRADVAQNIDILWVMKNAGCVQIDIGCESGSDRILKILKKGIMSEMILKSFENLKKVKMKTFATFIIGNPDETMEDVKKTENLAKFAPGSVSFLILVPYPGSDLYKIAIENKWFIEKNIIFDERWTNKQSDIPVIEASFKTKDLIEMRARLQNKYFFRNNIGIVVAFLMNPYFLFKVMLVIIRDPIFIYKSVKKTFRKRKLVELLEDLYQKFNEELMINFLRNIVTSE